MNELPACNSQQVTNPATMDERHNDPRHATTSPAACNQICRGSIRGNSFSKHGSNPRHFVVRPTAFESRGFSLDRFGHHLQRRLVGRMEECPVMVHADGCILRPDLTFVMRVV